MDKYINEAFIGNGNVRVTFNSKGKVLRILFPSPDHKQFINYLDFVIKIDGQILYLNDGSNKYSQHYVDKTNILITEIISERFNLKITLSDFCPPNEDIYIRNINIENLLDFDRNIEIIINSNAKSSLNYEISGYIKQGALIQYAKDYSMAIFSKEELDKNNVNNMEGKIDPDYFENKDYIGLSSMSAISFKERKIKGNSNLDFPVFVLLNDNLKNNITSQIDTEIIRIRKNNVKDLMLKTKKADLRYVRKHSEHKISKFPKEIQKIYIRSLLLFNVLYNNETGGYSAAIEVDEEKNFSGRYSFSWPRDNFFAFLGYMHLNYDEEIEKYYSKFLKKTQSRDGSWEQRFYTNGNLAPSWGYQIDETALIIGGAYEYYKITKKKEFLNSNLNMLEKAIKFLIKFTKKILNEENIQTFDIWETYKGANAYSLGSIFYAFSSTLQIYKVVEGKIKNKLKLDQIRRKREDIENLLPKLKKYIWHKFYDEEIKSFVRAEDEKVIDISSILLGTIFNVFSPKEKKITNTKIKIDEKLKTKNGGYLRFENDNYIGGNNPWPMSSLWISLYNILIGNDEEALENFNYVTNSASNLGFLAEQVNDEILKPAWVNGLGWMHGLYIYILNELNERGWI